MKKEKVLISIENIFLFFKTSMRTYLTWSWWTEEKFASSWYKIFWVRGYGNETTLNLTRGYVDFVFLFDNFVSRFCHKLFVKTSIFHSKWSQFRKMYAAERLRRQRSVLFSDTFKGGKSWNRILFRNTFWKDFSGEQSFSIFEIARKMQND